MFTSKLPFPSTVEECEHYLAEVPYRSKTRHKFIAATSTDSDNVIITEDGQVSPPYHETKSLRPMGPLLTTYGGKPFVRSARLYVDGLSNPQCIENTANSIYRVSWNWNIPYLFGKVNPAEYYVDPRGESYSVRRVAAMALFNTYHNLLDDQSEDKSAWVTRQKEASSYIERKPYLVPEDVRILAREIAIAGIRDMFPHTTRSDLTEPTSETLVYEELKERDKPHLSSFGPYTSYEPSSEINVSNLGS